MRKTVWLILRLALAGVLLVVACNAKNASSSHGKPAADDDNDDNDDASPDDDDDNDDNDASPECNAATCPSGCCDGGNCRPGDTNAQCGADGELCVPCGLGTDCQGGMCMPTVWRDTVSGHMWQLAAPDNQMTAAAAQTYCHNLTLGGYTGWRAPDIDGLRSLIRGCGFTAAGGACEVTDTCLPSICQNNACNGCPGDIGPGPEGVFWPSQLSGPNGVDGGYWSTSSITNKPGYVWAVNFNNGGIFQALAADQTSVRCMR